jgi:hypothetical protein
VNDHVIVDSSVLSPDLFMGRNDEVLPYFKVGIYNSDGSADGGENAEVTIRKYRESVLSMESDDDMAQYSEPEVEEDDVFFENRADESLDFGSGDKTSASERYLVIVKFGKNLMFSPSSTISTTTKKPLVLVSAASQSKPPKNCRNGKKKLGPDGECIKLSKKERRKLRKEGKLRKPRAIDEIELLKKHRTKATNMLRFKDLTHVNSTFEFVPTEYGDENEKCVLQPFGSSIWHNLDRELAQGFRDLGYGKTKFSRMKP